MGLQWAEWVVQKVSMAPLGLLVSAHPGPSLRALLSQFCAAAVPPGAVRVARQTPGARPAWAACLAVSIKSGKLSMTVDPPLPNLRDGRRLDKMDEGIGLTLATTAY